MNFHATILINISPKYSILFFAIQKHWKDENTNLAEVMLHIIRYFEFMKHIEKGKSILQISTFKPESATLKDFIKIKNSSKKV